jgi:hypothetical protein
MQRLLEIRSYVLKPGSAEQFHALVSEASVPLLKQWGIDVVSFGPSVHDSHAYFLMRAFDNLTQLTSSQAMFYESDAWRTGPRAAIIELIEYSTNTVLWLASDAIEAVRGRQV